MSNQVKEINEFFRYAGVSEVDAVRSQMLLTNRQARIFHMKYIEGHDINFIADTLGFCPRVINKELRIIRAKIAKSLGL